MKIAAAAVALAALGTAACGSGGGSSDKNATLTLWNMGAGPASQTTFLKGVIKQFQVKHPGVKVNIQYVPWAQATTKFQTVLRAGTGGPDVTEVGNTDVQSYVALGAFADITDNVKSWSLSKNLVSSALANDQSGGKTYAVPWYGGVRAVWYRKDLFQQDGIQIPTTWAQLVQAAQTIQQKNPGVAGIDAPNDFTNGIASFVWGAGGEYATKSGSTWTAQLTNPQTTAALEFYAGLVTKDHVSPTKYIGHNELQGPQQDFALGKLGMYIDGSWALPQLQKISTQYQSDWGSFPIPSQAGGQAPAFSGGSDLAVWNKSKHKDLAFEFLSTLDNEQNALAFAKSQFFLPQFTDLLSGTTFSSDPVLNGFAQSATKTKFLPQTPNWAQADDNQKIIPTLMKQLEQGADPTSSIAKANQQLTTALNQPTS